MHSLDAKGSTCTYMLGVVSLWLTYLMKSYLGNRTLVVRLIRRLKFIEKDTLVTYIEKNIWHHKNVQCFLRNEVSEINICNPFVAFFPYERCQSKTPFSHYLLLPSQNFVSSVRTLHTYCLFKCSEEGLFICIIC